jgi:hypothetical protein
MRRSFEERVVAADVPSPTRVRFREPWLEAR